MTESLAPRTAAYSRTVMTQLVFPEDANALGTAFGGQVMAWSDMAAAICSMRHSGGLTVTAAVDEFVFEVPLRIGDIAVVEARVNATFHTSMEVEVEVWAERPDTAARARCVQARFTFVAIDAARSPRTVPPLVSEGEGDARRAEEAAERRATRLARRARQGTT